MPTKKKAAAKKKSTPAKKAAPKKAAPKKAAPKKAAPKKAKSRAPTITLAETFPEGEEGIDLVCIAKAPQQVYVQALAVSPSGRFVVAGDLDNACRVIDIERGEVRSLAPAKDQVCEIAFLDRETAIIGDASGLLRVVDLRDGAERTAVAADDDVARLTKVKAANGVAAWGFVKGPMFMWRSGAARELPGYSGHLTGLFFDDDIVCASAALGHGAARISVHVWDAKGTPLRTLTEDVTGFVLEIVVVAGRIVAVTTGGNILIWDESGRCTRVELPAKAEPECVSRLDGTTKIAFLQADTLTIVDAVDGSTKTTSLAPWAGARAVQGNTAVLSSSEGKLGVFDLATQSLLLERACEPLRYASLSADRMTIATCNERGDVTAYRAHPPR